MFLPSSRWKGSSRIDISQLLANKHRHTCRLTTTQILQIKKVSKQYSRWGEATRSSPKPTQPGFSYPPYFLLYQFSSLQYYRLMLCGTLYLPRQGRGQQQHSKRRWQTFAGTLI